MSNIAAAFDAAGQGMDQIAGLEMNKEMMEAQAARSENLAILRNLLRWGGSRSSRSSAARS